eukprot:scaffold600_cov279-Pinguiococcus_pyrenoidosus.AAC.10
MLSMPRLSRMSGYSAPRAASLLLSGFHGDALPLVPQVAALAAFGRSDVRAKSARGVNDPRSEGLEVLGGAAVVAPHALPGTTWTRRKRPKRPGSPGVELIWLLPTPFRESTVRTSFSSPIRGTLGLKMSKVATAAPMVPVRAYRSVSNAILSVWAPASVPMVDSTVTTYTASEMLLPSANRSSTLRVWNASRQEVAKSPILMHQRTKYRGPPSPHSSCGTSTRTPLDWRVCSFGDKGLTTVTTDKRITSRARKAPMSASMSAVVNFRFRSLRLSKIRHTR